MDVWSHLYDIYCDGTSLFFPEEFVFLITFTFLSVYPLYSPLCSSSPRSSIFMTSSRYLKLAFLLCVCLCLENYYYRRERKRVKEIDDVWYHRRVVIIGVVISWLKLTLNLINHTHSVKFLRSHSLVFVVEVNLRAKQDNKIINKNKYIFNLFMWLIHQTTIVNKWSCSSTKIWFVAKITLFWHANFLILKNTKFLFFTTAKSPKISLRKKPFH